jgi:hypothetical protein
MQQHKVFPGEPHLANILKRASVAGKQGIEVKPTWTRKTVDGGLVCGIDYDLLHHFGYLSELIVRSSFPGGEGRSYTRLTPKGQWLLEWSEGKRFWSVLPNNDFVIRTNRRAS